VASAGQVSPAARGAVVPVGSGVPGRASVAARRVDRAVATITVPFESDARSGLPASLTGGISKNSPDSPQAVSETKTIVPDQVSQRRRMPYLPLLVHYQTIEISRLVHYRSSTHRRRKSLL
jgi:hypothetical protein